MQSQKTLPFIAHSVASPARPRSAKTVLRVLSHLKHGHLTVKLPDGSVQCYGAAQDRVNELSETLCATIDIHSWGVFPAALKSGDIGFAEAYLAGEWTSPDLTSLLHVLLLNRHAIETVFYGTWYGRLLYRLNHLLNHNSKSNSKKNIHAHYDLGNDFYRLWLDATMNYSSAWFGGNFTQSLSDAQTAKVNRALDQVRLRPGQRLLEIGCGWGALCEEAVARRGAHAVGVTLSEAQLEYAKARVPSADLRLQDYRDIADPPFDAICSIEMLEAVGQSYWPGYFQTLHRMLKPGGRACVQTIVIADELFDRYIASTDFIQQYIFPGGCLPSPAKFRAAAKQAGLVVEESFSFGKDYAETLRRWRQAFTAQLLQVQQLAFDERFIRIWMFYLCYCEAAFDGENTDVVQFTLKRPL
ncbi:MAG: class I SAM-dependent methyltransferase [Rhodoferax sp.]